MLPAEQCRALAEERRRTMEELAADGNVTRCVLAGGLAPARSRSPLRYARLHVRAAPAAQKITPALIEAAKKEGKVTWYTSVDLPVAEKIAKAFEAKYPGIAMKVERSGAERIFQRIGQEYASKHLRRATW